MLASGRSFLPRLAPSAQRGVKTKAKISVQLLKDWPGLGSQGEIVKVTPGQMRNQLHPNNGASYVLKGTPLKIPLRTREEILAEKETERLNLLEQQKLEEHADPSNQPKKGYNDILSALGIRKEKTTSSTDSPTSGLGFLKFPTKKELKEPKEPTSTISESPTSSSLFILQNSIQSLPPIINIQRESQNSGFLKKNLDSAEFAKHISKLTGSEISERDVSFTIVTKSGRVSSSQIDHVGSYNVTFKISSEISITRNISIHAANNITPESSTRPLDAQLPGVDKASTLDSSSSSTSSLSPDAPAEGTNIKPKSKSFEWENELLVNLQGKREK